MIGYPSNTCLAILVLSTLELCVVSQDFCESYKQNNYSLIVWSHTNNTFLLIIDKHFWRLSEENSEFVFHRKDFQASNSSAQWNESNYTFANVIYDYNDNKYQGILLIKDMNKIVKQNISIEGQDSSEEVDVQVFRHDFYDFFGNHFSGVKKQWEQTYPELHQKRFSLFIPKEQIEYEIIQWFKQNPKQLVREYALRQVYRTNDSYEIKYTYYPYGVISTNAKIHSQVERLYNFTAIPMIGIYLNSNNQLICFFKIKDDIKYCSIDECIREEYKTLISCVTEINWIPLTIVVIISVLLVIVIITSIVVYYCMRSHKIELKFSENTNRTFMDYSTDNTLQSSSSSSVSSGSKSTTKQVSPPKTPKPTTPAKTKQVAKKVEKVPPLKQQKPTTPPKGKGKMKPKKSPQLKK